MNRRPDTTLDETPTYLDQIVPAVRQRLEERKRRRPPSLLMSLSGPAGLPPDRASFVDALRRPNVTLIAEVKRASPSKGPIRPELDVPSLVTAYERGGAAALSVLTEDDHFSGALADLEAAATASALPILRKDFIVDEYQVHEARVFGASAVLLIAALLPGSHLPELADLARSLGLDALVEVHDRAELERALAVDGAVIGVNNRDLRTFKVSIETTLQLAPLVPDDRILVSESGIASSTDVEQLAARGVDAVLVGESLLRQPDVEAAARALSAASVTPTQRRNR